MKNLMTSTALFIVTCVAAQGQSLLFDNYNVTGSGTGFGLGSGVNSGINPPTTRLTGSLAAGMRYMVTDSTKGLANYSISANALQVAGATSSGRFTLSDNGTAPFNFGPVLETDRATAANPIVYDVTIGMANNTASGTQSRFSFALGTVENNANYWDFGIQLYRSTASSTRYAIGKRIDAVSCTTATDSTGTTGDLNSSITTTAAGTFGNLLNFVMRVTDAGAETTTFNSRIQLSTDGGSTWFYDTRTDTDLTSTGFRFDTNSRFFSWDIAGSTVATYDNFSLTMITPAVPEPSAVALGSLGLAALILRRRR
jgi:hypothetical protein